MRNTKTIQDDKARKAIKVAVPAHPDPTKFNKNELDN
jgi:hypothetical protein